MKIARTTFLSKDDTEFPKEGQVRIISILNATTKLWEEIMLAKLRSEIENHTPLHENQRGFVKGGSCIKNLDDLISIIEKFKQKKNPPARQKFGVKMA